MSAARPPKSRAFQSVLAVLLAVLCSMGYRSPAQTQSAAAASIPAATFDPTQRETQRSLSVDRDPVLSPDPEVKEPDASAEAVNTGKPGELQKKPGGVYTLSEDVDEVLLNCTVVDKNGHLVRDLNPKDFQLWEDNVPQTIVSFRYQDLPVSMGILVDNSGSMRDKRAAVNAAALRLVRASNPGDAAFIVNFSDHAYLDQDFTSNINSLEHGLSHTDSRGSTALYDAVAASADQLAQHAEQPKQVLLIITDGADNASRLTLEQAIRRVQGLGGPVVYSIGLLFGEDNKDAALRAKDALEKLSQDTGGLAYFPNSLEDVDQIAEEIAYDIRNQYTIGYHSTKAASLGGYRTVRVEAKAPKHGELIVRTRSGYYPKPHPQASPAQPVRTAAQ